MTLRREMAAKLLLLGFVIFFVLFFARPHGRFRTLALGDAVPEFTLRTDDGDELSLADYRGKIVVLNFWATWCLPCIEEMPSLNQLTSQYGPRGIEVIGISLDEDPDKYEEFLEEHEIAFQTLRHPARTISEMYGTFKLPETFIISRDGRLLNKLIGSANWTSPEMLQYFESLLANAEPVPNAAE